MQLDGQFARLLWNALTYVEISSLISKYYGLKKAVQYLFTCMGLYIYHVYQHKIWTQKIELAARFVML